MKTILYYSDENGNCEIQNFIKSQTDRKQDKIRAIITLLSEYGENLRRPFSGTLKEGIYELIIDFGQDKNRVFYFFIYQDFIILTHNFNKGRKRIPDKEMNLKIEKEIIKAINIREDFIKKFPDKKNLEEYLK